MFVTGKNLKEAVRAVATHKIIDPASEVAKMNAAYYQRLPGISRRDHVAREVSCLCILYYTRQLVLCSGWSLL